MNRIFLVGFMGAGKSRVGEALAQLLSSRFVDLDERLCRRFGVAIPEIFAHHGEAVFRASETEELAAVAATEHDVVVATGGGAFCSEGNRRLIEAAGATSIYLDLPWEALRRRLGAAHAGRPLYGSEAAARRLWEARQPAYRCADLIVELAGDEEPGEAAAMVAGALREASCAT
jgi:shikimate kinase